MRTKKNINLEIILVDPILIKILWINIIRIVWLTVRRITNLIWEFKGLLTNRFHVAKQCSVIDNRRCQNVVRTKTWHSRHSQIHHWCPSHIFTSSVIYYCTDSQQHGNSLFYMIKKQNVVKSEVIYTSAHQYLISKNQSRFVHNLSYNTMIESHGSYRI